MQNYLILRIEQYASEASYPYLSQQGQILSQVIVQVLEDFPFQKGEEKLFEERPNCGCSYVCIRLRGRTPTEEQLAYLRTVQPWAYKVWEDSAAPCVAAYEVIDEGRFQARKPSDTQFGYYYWGHNTSQEISLHPVEA